MGMIPSLVILILNWAIAVLDFGSIHCITTTTLINHISYKATKVIDSGYMVGAGSTSVLV